MGLFRIGILCLLVLGLASCSEENKETSQNSSPANQEQSENDGSLENPGPELISAKSSHHYPLGNAPEGGSRIKIYGLNFPNIGAIKVSGKDCEDIQIETVDIVNSAADEIFSRGATEAVSCVLPELSLGNHELEISTDENTYWLHPAQVLIEDNQLRGPLDWYKLHRNMFGNFQLANSIDFESKVIRKAKYFFGSLDGQGFSLTNMKLESTAKTTALFTIYDGGMQNLVFDSTIVQHNFSESLNEVHLVGLIAGVLGANGVINNVDVFDSQIDVTESNDVYVSAFFPFALNGSSFTDVVVSSDADWTVTTNALFNACVNGATTGQIAPNITLNADQGVLSGDFGNLANEGVLGLTCLIDNDLIAID